MAVIGYFRREYIENNEKKQLISRNNFIQSESYFLVYSLFDKIITNLEIKISCIITIS